MYVHSGCAADGGYFRLAGPFASWADGDRERLVVSQEAEPLLTPTLFSRGALLWLGLQMVLITRVYRPQGSVKMNTLWNLCPLQKGCTS